MKMKKTSIIIAAVLIAAAFAGCTMIEATMASPYITVRIGLFETALNLGAARPGETVAANFASSTYTAMADQINTDTFWDTQFDPDYKYKFELDAITDVEAVTGTMTATLRSTDTAENPVNVTFKMVEENGEWLIEEYHEAGTAVVKLLEAE